MRFTRTTFLVLSSMLLPALSATLYSDLPALSNEGTQAASIGGLLAPASANKAASADACHQCGNYNICCPDGTYCATDGTYVVCCPNGQLCHAGPPTGCAIQGQYLCPGKSWCCPNGVGCTANGCAY